MPKHCLIVDDTPQEEMIERIESKLRKKNIQVICYQLNVGSQARKDLLTDERIDLEKVTRAFEMEFHNYKLDLVCIDFDLEDGKVDGLDVLKQVHQLRPKTPCMIYSSNLDEVARKIIVEYERDGDRRKLLNKIKALAKYSIEDFVARDYYDERVVDILSKKQQSLESMIEEKLLENADLIFQQGYPPFSGKTLWEVALEVQKGTPRGNEFLYEIIELAIAQVITINS
jgi:hypothetical protein